MRKPTLDASAAAGSTLAVGSAIPCPHCGHTLLWSEDRGAHCDGCDDFDSETDLPPIKQTGPRLRCDERSANHFYGRYKGHIVQVERDHPSRAFAFLVVCPDGTRAADGVMRERTTLREAIIHALTGALLWPNIPDETRAE